MIQVAPGIMFDEAVIEQRFTTASGPGGQNVNKVATAVELRLDVASLPQMAPLLARLRSVAGSRLSAGGVLAVRSQRYRTQGRNREDALVRLVHLLVQAAHPPRSRRPTGPTASSRRQRLETKAHESEKKQARRPLKAEDD